MSNLSGYDFWIDSPPDNDLDWLFERIYEQAEELIDERFFASLNDRQLYVNDFADYELDSGDSDGYIDDGWRVTYSEDDIRKRIAAYEEEMGLMHTQPEHYYS